MSSRTCRNCKYEHLEEFDNPCKECYSFKKWEPKEDDMENENTTATIDTEAELKAQVAKLQEELEEANRKTCRLENEAHSRELILAEKMGMIEGLKFAIRCNGVSGGEV